MSRKRAPVERQQTQRRNTTAHIPGPRGIPRHINDGVEIVAAATAEAEISDDVPKKKKKKARVKREAVSKQNPPMSYGTVDG